MKPNARQMLKDWLDNVAKYHHALNEYCSNAIDPQGPPRKLVDSRALTNLGKLEEEVQEAPQAYLAAVRDGENDR